MNDKLNIKLIARTVADNCLAFGKSINAKRLDIRVVNSQTDTAMRSAGIKDYSDYKMNIVDAAIEIIEQSCIKIRQ
jgi:hypothetical protein